MAEEESDAAQKGYKLLGIEFAPVFLPIERRLQTFFVMLWTMTFTIFPVFCVVFCIFLLFTPLFWVAVSYWTWIFYDVVVKETSSRGGRRLPWFRSLWCWKYFCNYFPMSLIKTAELDPSKNYIMGYHPHGIIGAGVLGNFGTEATGFSKKFPGITPHPLTLLGNFKLPLLRGYLLYNGTCDVSKESIQYLMTKKGKGNAAVIVVGGAEEALEAHPGNYNLLLKNRKGFIKMAIKTGASLVPVYSFGENDLFQQVDNPKGSLVRTFQTKFKKALGVSPPLFHGRGVFNYNVGLLPFRNPIRTVVGKPIDVELCEKPDQEMIDKYHTLYLEGLSKLFDEYKVKYGISEDVKLNFF